MRSLLIIPLLVSGLAGCSSSGADSETTDNAELDSNEYCPTGALYDEAEDVCYVYCDGLNDNQCDALVEEVFGDFDEFVVDNYSGADTDELEEGTAKARYQVEEDLTLTTLENTDPDNDTKFQEIWASANKVLPRSKMIEAFSQYHIDSDGPDGTLAYVISDANQPSKWIIAFDDADYSSSTEREFVHTSIHEFGHVVFLAEDQLDTNSTENCPNYGIDEGCSKELSYINQFYQQFWSGIFDEYAAIETFEQETAFYEKYKDRFVNEYAATDPVEDAAEIFTNFVLREKPNNSDSVINQKILLMHSMQPLVKLRNDMRGKLTVTRARIKK